MPHRSPELAPAKNENDVRSLLYDHTDYDEITSLTMNPFGLDDLVDEYEFDGQQEDVGSDSSFARIFE